MKTSAARGQPVYSGATQKACALVAIFLSQGYTDIGVFFSHVANQDTKSSSRLLLSKQYAQATDCRAKEGKSFMFSCVV